MTVRADLETGDMALAYARSGYLVWPVVPGTKKPHPHAPLGRRGPQSASRDPDVVGRWWRRWPRANIHAVIPYGRVVVDVDPRNGGPSTPDPFPATLIAATGGGGFHLWYAHHGDLARYSVEHPGVDMLRSGQGVALPPSLHASGQRYAWLADRPVVPLPAWLIDAFAPPTFPDIRRGQKLNADRYTEGARQLVERSTVGCRHTALFEACCWYRRAGLSHADAEAELLPLVSCFDRSFTERDALTTIRSVWR